jgi:hypothetical protein
MIAAMLLSLLSATASPSIPVSALNSPPTALATLSAQADRVILGEVLTTRTVREKENAFTVATIRVWETLYGEEEPIVEVTLPGLMLASHDLTVHGSAKLITGFEVLLFLQGEQVVGLGDGAFVILGKKAWQRKYPSLPADPKSVGTHADDLYVSHDIDTVRAALR